MIHGYPRARRFAWMVTDLALIAAFGALVVARPSTPLATILLVAIPVVLLWGVTTLHFPRAVELDDRGVAFHAYGRVHRYAWQEVQRVQVRKFLVRDRVMVRISPAPPFAGRYWLLADLQGLDRVLARLEAHAAERAATRPS